MVFLQFVPFIALLIAANLAERSAGWRILTYLLVTLLNIVMILFSFICLLMPAHAGNAGGQSPRTICPSSLTGLRWGFGCWQPACSPSCPVIPALRRGLAALLPLDPRPVVHATAWFSLYLLGSVPIQLAMLGGSLDSLSDMGSLLDISALWQQGAAFIIMGLFGVGLWLRRSTDEVTESPRTAHAQRAPVGPGRRSGRPLRLARSRVAWAWGKLRSLVSFERIGKVSERSLAA
ncbi:hypothetical protein [Candidatus Amarolinea dominans]|uniref:hypothetical protein n=1 Tax=Candidatus Amarolinea dominans TaxID=3140696 RepID=UPI001DD206F2|nr:hypothetical protein [Anaerolineae bacterium]